MVTVADIIFIVVIKIILFYLVCFNDIFHFIVVVVPQLAVIQVAGLVCVCGSCYFIFCYW